MFIPHVILSIFMLLACVAGQDATCSASKPCVNGCCNKWGNCGFGPDFCGTNCISDCGRKSECNPGFGAKWSERDKCPLNVCCSKHGYCGTTKDFCGSKTVKRKTCSKTSGNARVIGYFEGWASNRPCNVFWPEQIPIGLYTHINFAFATIDPVSFKVVPAADGDVGLYKRLMLLKKRDPELKVFIAIGGWTFNDPGPTATTFSDIAASVPRQKAFIESLMSFMSTHGFDGVDLDWEYPVAEDRSGREVDFANFPKFMARLKTSLDSAKKGVSITLPASYWYLQHFDLKALAKTVSWFNIMSYDLHGTWDKGNQWTGNFLNAHTNLTEISDALDLIWRNDIDPSTVVLGLGFYGRAFTASSSSCLEPGCTFESGGERGRCSREVGILLNSEIDDLVKQHGAKPKLYEKEAVKIASWGDQWVAYDDEETFKMKSEFAQSLCMGGLMVWAISHDTKDSKYNMALAKAANRKVTKMGATDGSEDPFDTIDVPHPQCRWTNCGQTCPAGWIIMSRSDKGARKGEFMIDDSGCAEGSHAFCCPPDDKIPTCGWYTHNNGKCNNKCPDGTVEVGSNSKYCRKNYQAACCTTNTKSMRLYNTCEWGQWPMCNAQEGCPGVDRAKNKLLATSSTGSGGAHCNVWEIGKPGNYHVVLQDRKLCCDTSDEHASFSDCEWFTGVGSRPSGKKDDYCLSGCPSDRVRIAMDGYSQQCWNNGARARCCKPSYSSQTEIENPLLDEYRSVMKEYMDDPTCKNPGGLLQSRSWDALPVMSGNNESHHSPAHVHVHGHGHSHRHMRQHGLITHRHIHDDDHEDEDTTAVGLRARATTKQHSAESLLLVLITKVGTADMIEALEKVWNDAVGEKFPNLKFPGLRSFITKQPEYGSEGPIQMSHGVACKPNLWNARAKGSLTGVVDCTGSFCTKDGCEDLSDGDPANQAKVRRDGDGGDDVSGLLAEGGWDGHGSAFGVREITNHHLEKRARSRTYTAELPGSGSIRVTLPEYYVSDDYDSDHHIKDEAVDFVSRGDCSNGRVRHFVIGTGEMFEMEHVFDGNLIARFIEDATRGRLRSGAVARSGPVAVSFFVQARTMPLLPNAPPLPGGADFTRLYQRVMECLGSYDNTESFVLLHHEINAAKSKIMVHKNPLARDKMPAMASNMADPMAMLLRLRAAIGVPRYLDLSSTPNVNFKLTTVVNNVGEQWQHGADSYDALNPNNPTNVVEFWKEWRDDLFEDVTAWTKEFVEYGIKEMRKYWGVATGDMARQVLEILRGMEDDLSSLSINTSGFN